VARPSRRADLALLKPELQLLDPLAELLRRAPVPLPLEPRQLHPELLDQSQGNRLKGDVALSAEL